METTLKSMKTITSTVINVIYGSSSIVIKKTVKRETIEDGKIKEIRTTVEEITGDPSAGVDHLLAQLSPDDQQSIGTIKSNEGAGLPTTTAIHPCHFKSIDSSLGEATNCPAIDGQVKRSADDDKENTSTNQLQQYNRATPSDVSINQIEKERQLIRQFNQQCLERHNYYRSLHGVEPLTINEKLNELAQEWANHLASIGSLSHRPKSNFGENVFWISTRDIDAQKPVDSWYDEIKKYDWNKSTFISGTGHFTQVVWKNSKQLGIGKSSSPKGTFMVCNYDPAGNFMGKFKENVLPRKKVIN